MAISVTIAGLFMLSLCNGALAAVYIVNIAGSPLAARLESATRFARPEHATAYRRGLCRRHDAILAEATGSSDSKLYSYSRIYNGFAADLSEEDALALREHPSVVGVFEDVEHFPQTTYTRRFLGLDKAAPVGAWTKSTGEGIVIGVFDTGVWPEDPSFLDDGMADPPASFKGTCDAANEWDPSLCNKKIVAARFFAAAAQARNNISYADANSSDILSARDVDGHGSHMASIAAGAMVKDVEINGAPFGTAVGVAYKAHLAIYKVCWANPSADPADPSTYRICFSSDILAALEAATDDGIHVASLSLSPRPTTPVTRPLRKGLDMGALAASLAGVTVVVAAGNSGPGPLSVTNNVPWYLSVAASSDARSAQPSTTVAMGSGTSFVGTSYTGGSQPSGQQLPAIYAANASLPGVNASDARYCLESTLDAALVRGKIVLCERGVNSLEEKGFVLHELKAAGMIIKNRRVDSDDIITSLFHFLPAVHLHVDDGLAIRAYILNSTQATACIFPMAVLATEEAPLLLNFSSRGPNPLAPQILKPDVTAPGQNIVGAWSKIPTLTTFSTAHGQGDERTSAFFLASGTSQATAHVAGVAALLKSTHPKWSPSMIQSAIATSAYVLDNRKQNVKNQAGGNSSPFDMGAGHINPNAALDPGLVYAADRHYYSNFLCALGDDPAKIFAASGVVCPAEAFTLENYNSPSVVLPGVRRYAIATRVVTNVGAARATYAARLQQPAGVRITVSPSRLSLRAGESKKFRVYVRVLSRRLAGRYVFGALAWTDGVHMVRSPVAVQVS